MPSLSQSLGIHDFILATKSSVWIIIILPIEIRQKGQYNIRGQIRIYIYHIQTIIIIWEHTFLHLYVKIHNVIEDMLSCSGFIFRPWIHMGPISRMMHFHWSEKIFNACVCQIFIANNEKQKFCNLRLKHFLLCQKHLLSWLR